MGKTDLAGWWSIAMTVELNHLHNSRWYRCRGTLVWLEVWWAITQPGSRSLPTASHIVVHETEQQAHLNGSPLSHRFACMHRPLVTYFITSLPSFLNGLVTLLWHKNRKCSSSSSEYVPVSPQTWPSTTSLCHGWRHVTGYSTPARAWSSWPIQAVSPQGTWRPRCAVNLRLIQEASGWKNSSSNHIQGQGFVTQERVPSS